MTDVVRPAPFLIADNAALDFMNSNCFLAEKQVEWIGDGADLLDWMTEAGLISDGVKTACSERFSQESLDDVARDARDLRSWLRVFVDSGDRSDLKMLTDILAKDTLYWTVMPNDTDGSLGWQQERRYQKAVDLLLPIAEAIGDFICNIDPEQTRNCEGPQCTLWFRDITRNGKRRWCSMSVCGNRAKVAAHRARKRKDG